MFLSSVYINVFVWSVDFLLPLLSPGTHIMKNPRKVVFTLSKHIYSWHKKKCVLCMYWGGVCAHVWGGRRRTSGVLCHPSPPYSLEMGLVVKLEGAVFQLGRRPASRSIIPSSLPSPTAATLRVSGGALEGPNSGSNYLHSKRAYSMSHYLPTPN